MNTTIEKEIARIKRIAEIYSELKALIPGYESEYLDTYVEMADRFESIPVFYDILELVQSLEFALSDDNGIVEALSGWCEKNNTAAPFIALSMAREKIAKIKNTLGG